MPRNVLAHKTMTEMATEYVIRTTATEGVPTKLYSTSDLYDEMNKREGRDGVRDHLSKAFQTLKLLGE